MTQTPRIAFKSHRGRLALHVDGCPVPIAAYSPTSRPELFFSQTERFLRCGCNVYFINVPRGELQPGECGWAPCPYWVGDRIEPTYLRRLTTPSLDEQARFILDRNPDAWLILRGGADEPGSWRDLHPDELFLTEVGQRLDCPSMASSLYTDAAARATAAILTHALTHDWHARLIACWLGHRVEGTHAPLMHGWLYDHSPVMQAAWHARFPDTPLPTDPLRGSTADVAQLHYFQPASANQPYRDYLQLTRDLYAARSRAQSAAAAEAMGDHRILFLVDALKQHLMGWDNRSYFEDNVSSPLAYHDMLAGSGHLGVVDILEDPNLHGLITPHDYQARGLGGVHQPEGIADTCALRGKPFFGEMDTRSYTGAAHSQFFRARDDTQFAAITWRNFADAWTRNTHAYWMDVYTDWFASDAMQELIAQQVRQLRASVDWPHATMPGIAMVLDDTCYLETSGDGRYLAEAVMWAQRLGLARCGIPFRVYMLEDLTRADLPDHRVFYFPNHFKVDDQRLRVLEQHVFQRDRVVLWGPGSGISDGCTLSADHAARLTGFNFELIRANTPRLVQITDFDHPVTTALSPDTMLGSSLAFGPLLYPTDGRALGMTLTKRGRHAPGLALKTFRADDPARRWHSVFTTAATLPADLWRALARFAGAHVWCERNDVLMADRHMVALHTLKPGPVRIQLPEPAEVIDVVRDVSLGHHDTHLDLDTTPPQTHVLRLISRS